MTSTRSLLTTGTVGGTTETDGGDVGDLVVVINFRMGDHLGLESVDGVTILLLVTGAAAVITLRLDLELDTSDFFFFF